MRNRQTPRLLFMLLIAFACLGGCGQKGPLYLPDPQQETHETDSSKTVGD